MRRLSSSALSCPGLALVLSVLLLPLSAQQVSAQPRVVVVKGDYLGEGGLPNQPKAEECYRKVLRLLKLAGVPFATTSDSSLERDGLPDAGVAILPYNRAMTDAEANRLTAFVASGGKLLVFLMAHPRLLAQLGVTSSGYGQSATRLCLTDRLPGCPNSVAWKTQHTAALNATPGVSTLATWGGGAGPAICTNAAGAILGAEPLGLDETAGPALLRALLGSLCPELWPAMLPGTEADLGPFGRYRTLEELHRELDRRLPTCEALAPAVGSVQAAGAALQELRRALREQEFDRAVALEHEAQEAARRAYWQSYPPVAGELRGVWMHNYGEPDWATVAATLRRSNFNAAFPYMMSGGAAFYDSRVLPVHPKARSHDYLREAVAAARATGLPVHARMLNLSTLFGSDDTRTALRRAGRLMVSASGKSSDWLCPTNPQNRQVQVASALEMAGYGVTGIQFDYLRYPWKDTCFCSRCRAAFEEDMQVKVGDWPGDCTDGRYRGRFADWRRGQLTSLVGEMSKALRQRCPQLLISAAVFLNWESHRETFGQDWVEWIKRGYVDFVCPMDYTASMEKFELYVTRQEKWIGAQAPWAAGLGLYADSCNFSGPELAVEQIEMARRHGARGFVVFNYNQDFARDYLPWLSLGVASEPTEFNPRR